MAQPAQCRNGAGQDLRKAVGLGHVAHLGTDHQLDGAGLLLALPRSSRPGRSVRIGLDVVDGLYHVHTGDAIDAGVVDLGHHGKASLWQPLDVVEPLDDGELPERFGEVERPGMQPRNLDAELSPVTGLRQPDVTHVILEVEVAILDPVRVIQIERHVDQLLAKRSRQVQAALEVGEDVLEAQLAPLDRALVVNHDATDVHGRLGGFEVEKRGV